MEAQNASVYAENPSCLIDQLNLGRKLLNIRLIPGIPAVLYFVHPYSLARQPCSFRASDYSHKSSAAKQTTYGSYPKNESIP